MRVSAVSAAAHRRFNLQLQEGGSSPSGGPPALFRRRLLLPAGRHVPVRCEQPDPQRAPKFAPTANTPQRGVFRTSSIARFSISIKRSHVVRENQARFEEVYSTKEQLGEGAFGVARAAKKIPKLAVEDQKMFENEVEMLIELDHPHIVKLVEFFDEDSQYVLIFELCRGPDLFDRIVDVLESKNHDAGAGFCNEEGIDLGYNGGGAAVAGGEAERTESGAVDPASTAARPGFEEQEAGRLLRHMLKAILCCHSHQIIHRDIKPENFMFSSAEPNSALQMIDLGLSEFYRTDREHRSATPIGTIAYMSPEMLRGEAYDRQCDIWSLGVILWALLTGEPLFTHDCDKLCEKQILDPKYLESEWQRVFQYTPLTKNAITVEAQDLLHRMLQQDAKQRITAAEALSHPFILKSYSPLDYLPASVDGDPGSAVGAPLPSLFNRAATTSSPNQGAPTGGPPKVTSATSKIVNGGSGVQSSAVAGDPVLAHGLNNFDEHLVTKMTTFVSMPALKRVGRFIFAHLCGTDGDDLRLYRVTFRQLDKHGEGSLTKKDLVASLKEHRLVDESDSDVDTEETHSTVAEPGGVDAATLDADHPTSTAAQQTTPASTTSARDFLRDFETKIMPYLDSNNSDKLDFIEFLAATIEIEKVDNYENILRSVFSLMDTSKTGFLSVDDMAEILTSNTRDQLAAMLLEVAPSGEMTFAEFRAMMLRKDHLALVAEG